MINNFNYGKDPFYTKLIDKAIKHPDAIIEKQLDGNTWIFKYPNKEDKSYSSGKVQVRLLKLKKLSHRVRILLGKIGLFREYREQFDAAIKRLSKLADHPPFDLECVFPRQDQDSHELEPELVKEKASSEAHLAKIKQQLTRLASKQAGFLKQIEQQEALIRIEQEKLDGFMQEQARLNQQESALEKRREGLKRYYEGKKAWFLISLEKQQLKILQHELSKIPILTLKNQEEDFAILDEQQALLSEAKDILGQSIDASLSSTRDLRTEKKNLDCRVASLEQRISQKKGEEQALELKIEELSELAEKNPVSEDLDQSLSTVEESEKEAGFSTPKVASGQSLKQVHIDEEEEFLKRINLQSLLCNQTIPDFIVNPSIAATAILNSLSHSPLLVQNLAAYLDIQTAEATTKIKKLEALWNDETVWNDVFQNSSSDTIQQALEKLQRDPLFHRYAVLPLPGIIGFLQQIELGELLKRTPRQILDILLSRTQPSSPFEEHIKSYLGPWCEEVFRSSIDDVFSMDLAALKQKDKLSNCLKAAKIFLMLPGKKRIIKKFLLGTLDNLLNQYVNQQRKPASLATFKADSLWFVKVTFDRFFAKRSLDIFVKLVIKMLSHDVRTLEAVGILQKQAELLDGLKASNASDREVQKKIKSIKLIKQRFKEESDQRTEEILSTLISIMQEQLKAILESPFERELVEGLLKQVRSFKWDTASMDLLDQVWQGLIRPFLEELTSQQEQKLSSK
ncbi:MAG: hypothetical protein ACSNEK_03120 [Parachlamydiaceae bacterium]